MPKRRIQMLLLLIPKENRVYVYFLDNETKQMIYWSNNYHLNEKWYHNSKQPFYEQEGWQLLVESVPH